MSGSDRNADRIVRAWLEDGVTQLPDRLLDGVLDQLPDTRQRQPLLLTRRFYHMSSSLRIALAAAAAVVVIAGGALFVAGQNAGAPTLTGTPSPTPSSSAAPTATAEPRADQIPGGDTALAAGTYSYYDVGSQHLRVKLTVPDGWTGHEGWYVYGRPILADSTGVAIAPWGRSHPIHVVFPDPCVNSTVPAGSTVDDLVAALQSSTMHEGQPPSDITVSGYSGKEIHLYTDPSIDTSTCFEPGHLDPWDGRWVLPGTTHILWILDVEGTRLVIDASAEAGADDAQRAEMRQVLESIQIEVG